jgi:hypothetical protein
MYPEELKIKEEAEKHARLNTKKTLIILTIL